MGEADLACGRWTEAAACLEQAAVLNSRADDVLGSLERAVTEGLRHKPDDPRLHRAAGRLFAARGELDRALGSLQRSLEIDGTDPVALAAAGGVLFALGETREAAQAYRAALGFRPYWTDARQGLQAATAAGG